MALNKAIFTETCPYSVCFLEIILNVSREIIKSGYMCNIDPEREVLVKYLHV